MEENEIKQKSGEEVFQEETRTTFDRFLKIMEISGESAVDSLTTSEPLQRIPLVGGIIAAIKFGVSVKDALFAHKIKLFLDGISDKNTEKLKEKLRSDEAFGIRLTQKLILLLDRLADLEKAGILAKIVVSFANADIDRLTMERLLDAVDRIFVQDIQVMIDFYDLEGDAHEFIARNTESLQNLANSGLIGLGLQDGSGFITQYDKFNANQSGVALVTILQDGQPPIRKVTSPSRSKMFEFWSFHTPQKDSFEPVQQAVPDNALSCSGRLYSRLLASCA